LKIIDIPTEQTTAATDAILAIFAIGTIVYLNRIGMEDPWKMKIWCWIFALIAIAASLGTVVHGFVIPSRLKFLLWQPLVLSLSFSVGLLAVGVACDVWGENTARRLLPFIFISIVVLYSLAKLVTSGKLISIIFVTLILLVALGGYISLALRGQLEGAGFITAGLVVTIVAGIIQASRMVSFTFIWEFDHNGVFHLVQLLALFLLALGLRKSFL
jgi:hypothetical protein